jgi:hypothetical protein
MPHLATVAAKASASWPPAERRTPDFESLSLTAVRLNISNLPTCDPEPTNKGYREIPVHAARGAKARYAGRSAAGGGPQRNFTRGRECRRPAR